MRLRSLTIPALAFTLIAGGSALYTVLPDPAPAHAVTEDDPGWDCEHQGNRICAGSALTEDQKSLAWDTYQRSCGACSLKIDPSRGYRVTLTGYATVYPKLRETAIALPATDGRWYVFTAEYTTP